MFNFFGSKKEDDARPKPSIRPYNLGLHPWSSDDSEYRSYDDESSTGSNSDAFDDDVFDDEIEVGIEQTLSAFEVDKDSFASIIKDVRHNIVTAFSRDDNGVTPLVDMPTYKIRRKIATKVMAEKVSRGYKLCEESCNKCDMPLMERKGKIECKVCPTIKKWMDKQAHISNRVEHHVYVCDKDGDNAARTECDDTKTREDSEFTRNKCVASLSLDASLREGTSDIVSTVHGKDDEGFPENLSSIHDLFHLDSDDAVTSLMNKSGLSDEINDANDSFPADDEFVERRAKQIITESRRRGSRQGDFRSKFTITPHLNTNESDETFVVESRAMQIIAEARESLRRENDSAAEATFSSIGKSLEMPCSRGTNQYKSTTLRMNDKCKMSSRDAAILIQSIVRMSSLRRTFLEHLTHTRTRFIQISPARTNRPDLIFESRSRDMELDSDEDLEHVDWFVANRSDPRHTRGGDCNSDEYNIVLQSKNPIQSLSDSQIMMPQIDQGASPSILPNGTNSVRGDNKWIQPRTDPRGLEPPSISHNSQVVVTQSNNQLKTIFRGLEQGATRTNVLSDAKVDQRQHDFHAAADSQKNFHGLQQGMEPPYTLSNRSATLPQNDFQVIIDPQTMILGSKQGMMPSNSSNYAVPHVQPREQYSLQKSNNNCHPWQETDIFGESVVSPHAENNSYKFHDSNESVNHYGMSYRQDEIRHIFPTAANPAVNDTHLDASYIRNHSALANVSIRVNDAVSRAVDNTKKKLVPCSSDKSQFGGTLGLGKGQDKSALDLDAQRKFAMSRISHRTKLGWVIVNQCCNRCQMPLMARPSDVEKVCCVVCEDDFMNEPPQNRAADISHPDLGYVITRGSVSRNDPIHVTLGDQSVRGYTGMEATITNQSYNEFQSSMMGRPAYSSQSSVDGIDPPGMLGFNHLHNVALFQEAEHDSTFKYERSRATGIVPEPMIPTSVGDQPSMRALNTATHAAPTAVTEPFTRSLNTVPDYSVNEHLAPSRNMKLSSVLRNQPVITALDQTKYQRVGMVNTEHCRCLQNMTNMYNTNNHCRVCGLIPPTPPNTQSNLCSRLNGSQCKNDLVSSAQDAEKAYSDKNHFSRAHQKMIISIPSSSTDLDYGRRSNSCLSQGRVHRTATSLSPHPVKHSQFRFTNYSAQDWIHEQGSIPSPYKPLTPINSRGVSYFKAPNPDVHGTYYINGAAKENSYGEANSSNDAGPLNAVQEAKLRIENARNFVRSG